MQPIGPPPPSSSCAARVRANLFQERKIVEVLFVHQDRGRFFAVTEWLDGLTLDRYIEQHGAIACERALKLLTPCAQALATAHRAGIVHGAVHARNIFVCSATGGEPEHARVQNFGYGNLFARAEFSKHREQRDAEPRATVPEARPDERSALAADLHGFGVMLYQVLAGPSSSGKEAGAAAVGSTLAQRGQHIPPAVVDIIARALAVQPTERYASFDDMAKDLAKQLQPRSTPSPKRRKGSLHATLRWTPAVPKDVTERASIPLGATAPGGWYPDSSPSPNQKISVRDREAEYGGSAVARERPAQRASRASPRRRCHHSPSAGWTQRARTRGSRQRLRSKRSSGCRPTPGSRRSGLLRPPADRTIGCCRAGSAMWACAFRCLPVSPSPSNWLRARASASAERPAYARRPERGFDCACPAATSRARTCDADSDASGRLEPAAISGRRQARGGSRTRGRVKPTQVERYAATDCVVAGSGTRCAQAVQRSRPRSRRPQRRARAFQQPRARAPNAWNQAPTADSLRRAAAPLSPAVTPALAPRTVPQPASPSPAALTTNPASVEVGSQPKTLDAMKLL